MDFNILILSMEPNRLVLYKGKLIIFMWGPPEKKKLFLLRFIVTRNLY